MPATRGWRICGFDAGFLFYKIPAKGLQLQGNLAAGCGFMHLNGLPAGESNE